MSPELLSVAWDVPDMEAYLDATKAGPRDCNALASSGNRAGSALSRWGLRSSCRPKQLSAAPKQPGQALHDTSKEDIGFVGSKSKARWWVLGIVGDFSENPVGTTGFRPFSP